MTRKLGKQFFSWLPVVLILIVSFASGLFELLCVALISLFICAWVLFLLGHKLVLGKSEIGKLEAIELEVQIDLLDVLYNRRVSKNEDRFFALRGILELPAAAQLPPPDYSKPLGEIYQELTIHMAKTTGSLKVLIPAALSSFPDPGYPSWIPNWTAHCDALWARPPRMWRDLDATPGSTPHWKVDGVGSWAEVVSPRPKDSSSYQLHQILQNEGFLRCYAERTASKQHCVVPDSFGRAVSAWTPVSHRSKSGRCEYQRCMEQLDHQWVGFVLGSARRQIK